MALQNSMSCVVFKSVLFVGDWFWLNRCFGTPQKPYGRFSVLKNMGVSRNRGTPKMDGLQLNNPMKMDDLGVPLFSETSIWGHKIKMFG